MNSENSYEQVHRLSLIQRKAGVDREVRELVCAYARLRLDAGRSLPDFSAMEAFDETLPFSRYVPSSPLLSVADPRFQVFVASYSKEMFRRKLPVILSVSHLARKLDVSVRQLLWLSWNQSGCYRQFTIPKPSGGERTIHAPAGKLKHLQGWITRHLLAKTKPHKCATGFRRGMSILDNAVRHARRNVVVRIDLQDFFPSVDMHQVRRAYEKLGYPYSVAALLARLCTLDGALPQGASTSPALANLVCANLDERIYRLSLKLRCRYTRYADDLVISSNNANLPGVIPFLKDVITSEGFRVNEKKVHIMRRGQRQRVTGLVVNDQPGLTREHRRLLRAMGHRYATCGEESLEVPFASSPDANPVNVLAGHLAYARMVNPAHGDKLLAIKNGNSESELA